MSDPAPSLANPRLDRRVGLVVFALGFVSYAYFMQGRSWNHNSRFDTARAIVEQHTVRIDSYRKNTGNLAKWGGHYYSDKAPLTGVLAAIPYEVVHLAQPLLPMKWQVEAKFLPFASYFTTLFTSGLAAAFTAFLLYKFARRQGATPATAAAVGGVYAIATHVFPFATVLFGHDLAACLLFASFYLIAEDGGWKQTAVAGFIGSMAVVTEYPTAGAALVLGLCIAFGRGRQGWRRFLAPYAGGALLPVIAVAIYGYICFGDTFTLGYRHLTTGMMGKLSMFGVTYPHPDVLFLEMFGERRGLFFASPVLLACAIGIGMGLARRSPMTSWLRACVGVCVFYLLFVASYVWWDGGASFGPRHLIPMIPFLCAGGIFFHARFPKTFLGLAAISALVMLAGAGTTPIAGVHVGVLGSLLRVKVGMVPDPWVPGVLNPDTLQQGGRYVRMFNESTNFGHIIGLPGGWSLAPLIVIWGGFVALLYRMVRTVQVVAAPAVAAPAVPVQAPVVEQPAIKPPEAKAEARPPRRKRRR